MDIYIVSNDYFYINIGSPFVDVYIHYLYAQHVDNEIVVRGNEGFLASPETTTKTDYAYVVNRYYDDGAPTKALLSGYNYMYYSLKIIIYNSSYQLGEECTKFEVLASGSDNTNFGSCTELSEVTFNKANPLENNEVHINFQTSFTDTGALVTFTQECEFTILHEKGSIFSPDFPNLIPNELLPLTLCKWKLKGSGDVGILIYFNVSDSLRFTPIEDTGMIDNEYSSETQTWFTYLFNTLTITTNMVHNMSFSLTYERKDLNVKASRYSSYRIKPEDAYNIISNVYASNFYIIGRFTGTYSKTRNLRFLYSNISDYIDIHLNKETWFIADGPTYLWTIPVASSDYAYIRYVANNDVCNQFFHPALTFTLFIFSPISKFVLDISNRKQEASYNCQWQLRARKSTNRLKIILDSLHLDNGAVLTVETNGVKQTVTALSEIVSTNDELLIKFMKPITDLQSGFVLYAYEMYNTYITLEEGQNVTYRSPWRPVSIQKPSYAKWYYSDMIGHTELIFEVVDSKYSVTVNDDDSAIINICHDEAFPATDVKRFRFRNLTIQSLGGCRDFSFILSVIDVEITTALPTTELYTTPNITMEIHEDGFPLWWIPLILLLLLLLFLLLLFILLCGINKKKKKENDVPRKSSIKPWELGRVDRGENVIEVIKSRTVDNENTVELAKTATHDIASLSINIDLMSSKASSVASYGSFSAKNKKTSSISKIKKRKPSNVKDKSGVAFKKKKKPMSKSPREPTVEVRVMEDNELNPWNAMNYDRHLMGHSPNEEHHVERLLSISEGFILEDMEREGLSSRLPTRRISPENVLEHNIGEEDKTLRKIKKKKKPHFHFPSLLPYERRKRNRHANCIPKD